MSDMRIYGAGAAVPPQGYRTQGQQDSPAANEAERTQFDQPLFRKEDSARSLVEMMKEAREKAEERKKSLDPPKNSSQYGDTAMTAYARLARAKTQAEVSAAAGYARRCIARFQAELRQDGGDPQRIRAAISQLQKAVSRAGKKRKDLEREKLMKARQARAEQEKQRQKAQRLRQELLRRQSMRFVREQSYLREAEIDNRLQAQLAETRMELRAQAQELAAAVPPSLESAAQQYTAQAAAAEAPAPEINLQA